MLCDPSVGNRANDRERDIRRLAHETRQHLPQRLVPRGRLRDACQQGVELRFEFRAVHHRCRRGPKAEFDRLLRSRETRAELFQDRKAPWNFSSPEVAGRQRRQQGGSRVRPFLLLEPLDLPQSFLRRRLLFLPREQPDQMVFPTMVWNVAKCREVLGDVGLPLALVTPAPDQPADPCARWQTAIRPPAGKVGTRRGDVPFRGRDGDIRGFASVRQLQLRDKLPAVPGHGRPQTLLNVETTLAVFVEEGVEPIGFVEPLRFVQRSRRIRGDRDGVAPPGGFRGHRDLPPGGPDSEGNQEQRRCRRNSEHHHRDLPSLGLG